MRFLPERHQDDGVKIARQLASQSRRRDRPQIAHRFGCRRRAGTFVRGKHFPRSQNSRAGFFGILFADGPFDFMRDSALEAVWAPAGHQAIEDDAERIDVARGGNRISANVFRTGVLRRQNTIPGRRSCRLIGRVWVEHFGDAEIQQFGYAV